MRFSTLLALAPALVSAANITVQVGQGGLIYNPKTLQAQTGDILIFEFVSGTHTVTQSTFEAPCVQAPGGVDSGVKTSTGTEPFEQWEFTVPSTDPLWFFCSVQQHCQQGMVFSLNPTTEQTHDEFEAAARGGGTSNSAAPTSSGSAATPSATRPTTPTGSGTTRPTGSGSATPSGSGAASPSPSNGALQMAGNAAGVLAAFGLITGLTL